MPSQAEEGSKELYLAAIAQGAPDNAYVRTLFNPGDGLLADVAEVATKQLLARGGMDFFTLLLEMVNPKNGSGAANYIDWLQSQMDNAAALERNRVQIEKIKTTILAEIVSQKRPVLVIAHSQGNILVNEAVDELKTHWLTQNIAGVQATGVVGIGVASRLDLRKLPYSSGLYRYITFDKDVIIKKLPLLGELDANFLGESSLLSLDPTNHTLINTYLGKYTHGDYVDSNQDDTYSRTIIGELIKDMFRRTAEAWPCVTLATNPVELQTEKPVELVVSVTVGGAPLPYSPASITISSESDNKILCQNIAVIEGRASCSGVTFPVGKEKENLIVSLSRGTDYPEIKYPPVEIILIPSKTHWQGKYRIATCTPLPDATTILENPCYIDGPVAMAAGSNFYFDDISSNVIFGSDWMLRNVIASCNIITNTLSCTPFSSDVVETVRRVLPLNWKSTDNEFRYSIDFALFRHPAFINTSGTRETIFTVTSRTATMLSGTFTISTVSSYITSSQELKVVNTTAQGPWVATLINDSLPATKMNGYDFCEWNNSASKQMEEDPSSIYVRPAGGESILNGCVFGQ